MAAYAALAPLSLLLGRLLNSSQVRILPTSREIILFAHQKIWSLRNATQTFEMSERSRSCSERAKALDQKIKELVNAVEDILEPYLSRQYLSQIDISLASDPNGLLRFTVDLEEVKQEIDSFITALMHITEEYQELNWVLDDDRMSSRSTSESEMELEEEEEEDDENIEYNEEDLLSTSNYKMVGLFDQFVELRSSLIRSCSSTAIISIIGMAGIGKTALAKQLYNDPLVLNHFKYRAFVSIGQKYQLKRIIIDILSQMESHLDIANMQRKSKRDLLYYFQLKFLRKRSYLLVLDDLWSYTLLSELWFPETIESKCRILLTTGIESSPRSSKFTMRFLDEEESWSLLCEKVFGKDSWCPFELIKVGKKIAEDCEGLPLAIIAVADILAKGDNTLEYWKKVSEDENPLSIGTENQHPMLDVLYPSYDRLPQILKNCFLYMGVFPRRHKIVASKLIKLWIAEGFVHYYDRIVSENVKGGISDMIEGMDTLEKLSSQSVVVGIDRTSRYRMKTCKLHSVFWHLSVSEARKENLFQVVSRYSSSSLAGVINSRRLCVHNNTLFGIKDAYKSMSSISNARSLLCTGPQHDYPIPMCFEMRLLRVLDAITIRFYEFPVEVVELVHLRYLAFTYNGKIHPSISQLWNLEFLIVHQHISTASPDDSSYLPMEIWNMKSLRHLQVKGALLPSPCTGVMLPRLSTVIDINARSLTAVVVNSIPNLQRLGILIYSSAHDAFSFAQNLCCIKDLKILKCVVVNPKPKSQVVVPPAPFKIFPKGLKKLSLSGFGYPWKYMREISGLEELQVLKLRNYAFQGPDWKAAFRGTRIHVLILEDLDLVHWRVTPSSFPYLECLEIRHCYRLQEIPIELGLSWIKLIEVMPSVVASAKNMIRQKNKGADRMIQLHVDCSWEDGN